MAENEPEDVPKSVFLQISQNVKVMELNSVFSTNINIHIPVILSYV